MPICNAYQSCSSSQLSASEFTNRYLEFALYASALLGWPVNMILAQWSIESDWARYDICSPYYNPGNTATGSTETRYSSLCSGVEIGFVEWANNNYAHESSGETYQELVQLAYENGYTIPSSNNYGCLPGAWQTFSPGLQAACAALGASGWAQTDYCYCSAGSGTNCCSNSNYAGQTLYSRAINDFGNYNFVQEGPYLLSCCQ